MPSPKSLIFFAFSFLCLPLYASAQDSEENQVPEKEEDGFDFMQIFDQNGNKMIQKQEFTNYILSQQDIVDAFDGGDLQGNVNIAFQVYDVDNDGHLNQEELDLFEKQMWSLKQDYDEEQIAAKISEQAENTVEQQI